MPLRQVVHQSGSLLGRNSRMCPSLVKLTNSATPSPAQSSPGCSTGLCTDCLVNTTSQHTMMHSWRLLMSVLSACYPAFTLSGTWSTLWIQRRSESRMPLPPLSTLPAMWLDSLWRGTLSELDGHTFSLSKYITTFYYPVKISHKVYCFSHMNQLCSAFQVVHNVTSLKALQFYMVC